MKRVFLVDVGVLKEEQWSKSYSWSRFIETNEERVRAQTPSLSHADSMMLGGSRGFPSPRNKSCLFADSKII
jgi:hypothetical protein